MRQFTSDELRKAWKQFYIDRGHVDVGAVSLVSDGSTGVMFNVAGMQPLMPYLLSTRSVDISFDILVHLYQRNSP